MEYMVECDETFLDNIHRDELRDHGCRASGYLESLDPLSHAEGIVPGGIIKILSVRAGTFKIFLGFSQLKTKCYLFRIQNWFLVIL